MKLKCTLKIKDKVLRNRIVMPPMATAKATEDGNITEEILKYYDEKTKDESLGLLIQEHAYVLKEGKAHPGQVGFLAENIEGLKRLVNLVHQNKTLIVAQISHAGGATDPSITHTKTIAPSNVMLNRATVEPKPMTKDDIERVKKAYVEAAIRAKEIGYDGVEIHSAHGYLLNQFYSPLTNHRTDEYGKTLEGRLKIHLEIIKAIREAVGNDYLLMIRLGGCDYLENGSTISDAVVASKMLEAAGIDILDISGGIKSYRKGDQNDEIYFRSMSIEVKKNVNIPVLLTGGVKNAEQAEMLLKTNACDLVGVGREILKDSHWALKALSSNS